LTTSFVPSFSLCSSHRFRSFPYKSQISCAVVLNLASPSEIKFKKTQILLLTFFLDQEIEIAISISIFLSIFEFHRPSSLGDHPILITQKLFLGFFRFFYSKLSFKLIIFSPAANDPSIFL